jgi:transcriptional regulator with XRE-family HTH domain
MDLGLLQKQVAEQIGVDATTIWNWECHESSPQIHVIPTVIRFLGYDPFLPARSFAEILKATRRELGLSQTLMAERIGIDPVTLRNWENGRRRPSQMTAPS